MILWCYKKCSTCKKSEKFLIENNFEFETRDLKENTPNIKELTNIIDKSGYDIKKFFNTSGLVYKELKLKDKLNGLTKEEKIKLLSSNGMLIKRPILITDSQIYISFKESEWKTIKKRNY